MKWDARTGGNHWGADKPRRFFGDKHWAEPLKWNRDAEKSQERRRMFIMSMGDWAEGRPDQRPHVERLQRETIPQTPWLDKLMLTKRPQLIPSLWTLGRRADVWMGITAENQHWLNIRWSCLRHVEAAIYWLSMEPLFERIVLPDSFLALGKRAWAIVGGQSGPGSVPLDINAARYMRDQCVEASVPFHYKQHGEYLPPDQDGALVGVHQILNASRTPERVGKKKAGRILDGRTWDEFPEVPR
jgi:protein gp37